MLPIYVASYSGVCELVFVKACQTFEKLIRPKVGMTVRQLLY